MRLVVDWFERSGVSGHPLALESGARWYSEALLASRFLATRRGDSLAESFTHADGIIGHFDISPGVRGDAVLRSEARQFVVIEAKLGSGLSKGVKNASGFGQAARSVACMAHAIDRARIRPESLISLGFYVVAPAQRINDGVFEDLMTKRRIAQQVRDRVDSYGGEHDRWFEESFLPTLDAMTVELLCWQSVIGYIESCDRGTGFGEFFRQCLAFNRVAPLRDR